MPGRSSTATQREARAQRIWSAWDSGEPASVIAKRERISDRQVRRVLAAQSITEAALVPDLVVSELVEVDPFAELSQAIAVHRDAIARLRMIAGRAQNDAVAVGAAKASAAIAADLIGLLARGGVLPSSPFQRRTEWQWRTAWEQLGSALCERGIDVDAFVTQLRDRLSNGARTEVQISGVGPDVGVGVVA